MAPQMYRNCVGNSVCAVLAILLPLPWALGAAAPLPIESAEKKEVRLAALPEHEVRCADGSVLKVKVLEEEATLKTPYGTLVIPFANISEIEAATRTPDEVTRRISVALSELSSTEIKRREAASAELARLQLKAYPALVKAESEKDAEVRRRVKMLLEKIRNSVAEEDLVVRGSDVVTTVDSKITGYIQGASLRVHTEQFGELRLRLSDVRSIRRAGGDQDDKEKPERAQPDPGHLHGYQAQAGKTFTFQVTGAATGSVWGTDVYTLDSALAVAAVHAGVVGIGKTATVKVRILPPRNGFAASNRNGVVTHPYGIYPGAYEFVKKGSAVVREAP